MDSPTLRSLTVHRYRSVKPGTTLTFARGTNVILGRNGTGKTTLLNVVAALISGNLRLLEEPEYDLAYSIDCNEGSLAARVQSSRRNLAGTALGEGDLPALPASEFQASLTVSVREPPLELTVEIGGTGTRYSVNGREDLSGDLANVSDYGFIIPVQLISIAARLEPDAGNSLYQIARAGFHPFFDRMDEGLKQFDTLLHGAEIRRVGSTVTPFFGAWSTPNVRSALEKSAPPFIEIPLDELPDLRHAVEYLGFSSGRARFDLESVIPAREDTPETFRYGRLGFSFTRADGSVLPHGHLSYGQKRLLSFFGYLAANRNFAVIDELANGLHHSWIGACAVALDGRQSFLTSQNPLLLDALPFSSADEVRQTFVVCSSRMQEGREVLEWRGLNSGEAADFWSAYEAGIQQVGEILQQKELW